MWFRGQIIDEKSLIQALRNKDDAGAPLDVFHNETLDKNSDLFKFDNVLLSPHISGNFQDNHIKMIK